MEKLNGNPAYLVQPWRDCSIANMHIYPVKTPLWVQKLIPSALWHFPRNENVLYLSFDDGPSPQLTPWILETLEKWKAKATFFCVGENINKYPQLYQEITELGHTIGNHSYNHLNGWLTNDKSYFQNIALNASQTGSKLYRPPYGRMKPSQIRHLKKRYQLVYWDVLSGDFDRDLSPEKCLKNILENARQGSIIVLHDNIKADKSLKYVLPRLLQHYAEKKWEMRNIDPNYGN
ncbi:MAG TPA: polysaccharide deacetylase family protein [Saprospiraceae bacterium]|nr:polysaccharide deacetylase family protein [Saprospiraceae bacterium]